MNVEIGSKVWFHDYSGVNSGEVIAIINSKYSSRNIACVKCNDEFKSIDINPNQMFLTRHDAILNLAMKKQQEAAKLLTDAASLFKEAGGIKEEPAAN